MELNWNTVICGVLLPISGYCLKALIDIRGHLARINGRVGTVEQKVVMHEVYVEKRHNENREDIQRIERDVSELQQGFAGMSGSIARDIVSALKKEGRIRP